MDLQVLWFMFGVFLIWFQIIIPALKQRAIFPLKKFFPSSIDIMNFSIWSFALLGASLLMALVALQLGNIKLNRENTEGN